MQKSTRAVLLVGLIAVWTAGQPALAENAQDTAELRLMAARVNSERLTLTWAGGRPSYQVQTRGGLDQPWANVGEPTTSTSLVIPLEAGRAFFRVLSDYTARYEVTFDATWSAVTHPQDWPNPGHWSGLVGAIHNDRVSFFNEGEAASEGIRLMAERGQQSPLLAEVAPAIQAGNAHFELRGSGIGVSPGTVRLIFPAPMRRDYPLVTLCSMVAPSPDWFVGVSGLSLLEGAEWVSQVTVPLLPYDAGTDSGATFASPDQVTIPRGVITRLTDFPIGRDGAVVPFGTFTFKRLDGRDAGF